MGDPKFQKKKYKAPRHPWEAERIKEENQLIREYGLVNKTEIWRMESLLRNWHEQAKMIVGLPEEKREAAQKILIDKLQRLGTLGEGADLDAVLSLTLRDVLERRLQTVVYKKKLAVTPRQARQFVVHNKIMVNNIRVTSPSYLVKIKDEISFIPGFAPIRPLKEVKEEIKVEMREESENA